MLLENIGKRILTPEPLGIFDIFCQPQKLSRAFVRYIVLEDLKR